MKREDIYVGTLMKCTNFKGYLKDGERTFVPEFEIGSMKTGYFKYNSKVIKEHAIFIKKEEGFICLGLLNNCIEEFLANIGLGMNMVYTTPCCDGDYYVLKDSLRPYYTEKLKKDIYVKRLKRKVLLDPRIKSGIEH